MRTLLLALLAIVIFIEEWGWRPLTAYAALIAHWPPLAQLEAWLQRSPPWVALLMFSVPAVALFPLKLMALGLIHKGYAAWGVAIILAAKLLGTALVGRLFMVVESQLMQFPWLARAITWWRSTRVRIITWVRASAVWRTAHRHKRWLRLCVHGLARRLRVVKNGR